VSWFLKRDKACSIQNGLVLGSSRKLMDLMLEELVRAIDLERCFCFNKFFLRKALALARLPEDEVLQDSALIFNDIMFIT
jgi:hypothetical protein